MASDTASGLGARGNASRSGAAGGGLDAKLEAFAAPLVLAVRQLLPTPPRRDAAGRPTSRKPLGTIDTGSGEGFWMAGAEAAADEENEAATAAAEAKE